MCPQGWEAPPASSRRPSGQAGLLRCAGVGVCRYHGKGALVGHILPQGGSALGIREGGEVTGVAERGGGGQDEGGDSDKTNQDFWGWGGEFGISPLPPPSSSRGRSPPPLAFSLGFKPPTPRFRGRDPRLPTRKPCN